MRKVLTASRTREAALIAGVLAPVVLNRELQRSYRALSPSGRVGLAAMAAATLAGHLTEGTRGFPFIPWNMYTFPHEGDPEIFEHDAVTRSGVIMPLPLSSFLAARNVGRLTEGLRRQVAAGRQEEHEGSMRAIAARCNRVRAEDPIVTVVVNEVTVSAATGERSEVRELWRVSV